LYTKLKKRRKYNISKEIAEGIIIDYTKEGKVISIEILDASKRMPIKSIKDIAEMGSKGEESSRLQPWRGLKVALPVEAI
jgi:uncharacterized protein YuzE